MGKYIINHSVNGYTKVDILDTVITDTKDNIIVLVLDDSTNDRLSDYYERVTDILLSDNRLYIIIVGKESRIRKAIGYINSEEFSYTLDIQDCEEQTEEYQQQTAALEQFIDEYNQALQIFKTGMYKKES